MPPKKSAPPAAQPSPAATEPKPSAPETASSTNRRPWIKRTPVEVVLEQIGKQEKRAAEMREEITREERELQKLQQAKKVLEST